MDSNNLLHAPQQQTAIINDYNEIDLLQDNGFRITTSRFFTDIENHLKVYIKIMIFIYTLMHIQN